jgi:hypothetical protein
VLILGQKLALYGDDDEERDNLMSGHTFGSAVAEARKLKRLTIKALVRSNPSLLHFDELSWNAIEQDRYDPRNLADPTLAALEAVLGIDVEELKKLAAGFDQAYAEQSRVWSLLTIEAHAFRARRAVD